MHDQDYYDQLISRYLSGDATPDEIVAGCRSLVLLEQSNEVILGITRHFRHPSHAPLTLRVPLNQCHGVVYDGSLVQLRRSGLDSVLSLKLP